MTTQNAAALIPVSRPTIGMAMMVAAMLLLPVGDTLVKLLTQVLAPAQLAAMRCFVQACALAIMFFVFRKKQRGKIFTHWSVLSGCLAAVISISLITAFQAMPIATAIAIFFVEPLILTLLAGVFLREKPGPRRYVAIGVGMLGVLLILRPNFAEFGLVVIYPLIGATAYALNMIVSKQATQRSSALTFQVGASSCAAVAAIVWMFAQQEQGDALVALTSIPPWVLGSVIVSGILAAVTFLLIASAFSFAQASLLAPFQYLEILGATALGFWIFGDVPDTLTIIGALILLGSGLYLLHRERKAEIPSQQIRARNDR
ncbi:DMT family transporter [Albirhodobacter sp. R86504]|jgi:drug/metabolite transporter (DMT)-like permease|uniref:DMT family transporter n=1 Tax=Albirhodobacter sp. R86504 TaxID=3093848 RepID=UPI00366C6BCD